MSNGNNPKPIVVESKVDTGTTDGKAASNETANVASVFTSRHLALAHLVSAIVMRHGKPQVGREAEQVDDAERILRAIEKRE